MEQVLIESAGGYETLNVQSGIALEDGLKPSVTNRRREAAEGMLVGYQSGLGRPGCVRVRTFAAGVNYADVCIRWGLYKSALEFVGWPITPGFEFVGVVEEIWGLEEGANGDGGDTEGADEEWSEGLAGHASRCLDNLRVRGIKVGTRVMGVTRFGAYASQLIVPGDSLFVLPESSVMTPIQAAGFPAVYLTAYFAMFELAHPYEGDTVLIHSAAGGVGSALVQLAKIAGSKVVGVVGSSHKVQACLDFGADFVIDKSTEDLWARAREISPEGFDAVYDANGVETLKSSYDNLAPGGKLIVYGFHTMLPKTGGRTNILKLAWNWARSPMFNPLDMTSANKSVMALNLSFLFSKKERFVTMFEKMLAWIEEGKLKPPVVTTFDLKDVAKAHAAIESGKTIGKLILLTGGARDGEDLGEADAPGGASVDQRDSNS